MLDQITVIKRDGREVPFDRCRISDAILKAAKDFEEFSPADVVELTDRICNKLYHRGHPSFAVEEIQDEVVDTLTSTFPKIATAYQLYRQKRTDVREMKSVENQLISDVVFIDAKDNDDARENANINADAPAGGMLKIGAGVTKEFYLRNLVKPEHAQMHRDGKIHIHDADWSPLCWNCTDAKTLMVFKAPDGRIIHAEAQFFSNFYNEQGILEFPAGWEVLSSDGQFVPLLRSWRRLETSSILHFESAGADIRLTDEHRVPVIRGGQRIEVTAKEIITGDKFIFGVQPETDTQRYTVFNVFDAVGPSQDFWLSPEAEKQFRWKLHEAGKTQEFLAKHPFNYDTHVDFAMYFEYRNEVMMDEATLTVRCSRGRHDYPAIIPLTPELGRLIGYLYSEGSVGSNDGAVVWTNADPAILSEMRALLATVYPNNKVTECVNAWGTTCLIISSLFWNRLFKFYLANKINSGNMRLPIWYADANRAFLAGVVGALLDGDGSLANDTSCVYSTGCEDFARDLKRILLSLNILSKHRKDNSKGTNATFGDITVERNYDMHYVVFPRTMLIEQKIPSIILQRSLQRRPEISQIRDRNTITSITREPYCDYVYDFETGNHYFYADGVIVHNCISLPLGKLLRKGFSNGHGALREPATINSAATLMCIIIQANQNQMFGGQAIPMMDYDLAPYVAKSYVRNVALYLEVHGYSDYKFLKENFVKPMDVYIARNKHVINDDGYAAIKSVLHQILPHSVLLNEESELFDFVLKKTERDVYQSMEATVHNLCSLASRAGSQVPFSSVNFGTDTSEEGRMVSRNLMLALDAGLGAGETAIFPISIFKLKKGINRAEGEPNYDLFKLACKVSAKRLFPNFVNIDAPFNLQYYKPGHPETQVSSMGAVAKGTVSITYGNDVYTGDISQFDAWLISRGYISDSDFIQFDQYTDYVNLPQGFFITDPTGVNGKAQIKKYMRYADPHLDWYKTTFQHFGAITTVYLTEDHPLPVAYLDGTVTGDQEVVCEIEGMKFHRTPLNKIDQSKKVFGLMNIDGELIAAQLNFEIDHMYHAVGYDFETSTDRFVIKNIVSNNCRTRVIGNYYDPTRQIVPGRGNLFVVTINLPWLALETKESLKEGEDLYEKFMQDVDETIDACVDQLNDRFEMICKRTGKNFPFLVGQGVYLDSEKIGPNDSIREMIMHGTRTVGFIGLAETLQVLFGKHHGESEFAQEKGLEIISHMNTRITELAKKTNINYSFMGSPAEGCTGRLCRLLRKRFGVIPGITDKEYIVNSHHIRTDYPISAWDKVRIEAPYHALEPAGAISYIELDSDASKNVKAFEQLVNFMADSNMGYFSINHPVDRDPICGYIGVIGDTCPRCGRHEGEGVPAGKLMSLLTYSPDPIYAVRPHMLEEEESDVVPNTLSSSEDFSIIE